MSRRSLVFTIALMGLALTPAIARGSTEGTFTCDGKDATLVGTEGNDVLRGTADHDVIVGRGGDDRIVGFDGNDTLCGNAGNDVLIGRAGYDTLLGGPGDDLIIGGGGYDTVSFAMSATGVEASLLALTATGEGTDTLRRVERLTGSEHDDVLIGNSKANYLLGLGGDDTINGSGGDDIIDAGTGNDIAKGGYGDDQVEGGLGRDVLSGGGNEDRLYGGCYPIACTGDARDLLYGNTEDDYLNGGSGNDLLRGGTGDDEIRGREGTDTSIGEGGWDACWTTERSRTCEAVTTGEWCQRCRTFNSSSYSYRRVYTQESPQVVIRVNDTSMSSRSYWYDPEGVSAPSCPVTGGCIVRQPTDCHLGSCLITAHFFYIDGENREPGMYKVDCTYGGTVYGGYFAIKPATP